MTDKSFCTKPMLPKEPPPMDMQVEEYVRPPCMPLLPPCGHKVPPPEPEPAMPMCPCPAPNLPPCRYRGPPPGEEDCMFKDPDKKKDTKKGFK